MKVYWAVSVVAALSFIQSAHAGSFGAYAFPQKGQTQEQQVQDESSCAQWAQNQTGLNPAVLEYQQQQAMASQQQATQQQQQLESTATIRRVGRAALTGAALGGINEGMDDGAGKGAAMGVTMATSQAIGQSKDKKAQSAVNGANAQSQQVQANTQKYVRAYCACMEGKGYSIR